MMQLKLWMLAAIVSLCGMTLFTSCSNDDSPVIPITSRNVTINGLKYYLYPETHEAVIDNGNTWAGELDIPSEVNYSGQTFTVSGIALMAFSNCTELTKVRIPKTLVNIIHHYLGDDLESGGAVSPYCMNLFQRCTALTSIEVDADNSSMRSEDGVLFSKNGTGLYCYPAGIKAEKYVVPEGVTWIGASAFSGNEHIVSVELPATVEKLYSAFSGCVRLEEINLPEHLTFLDAYMFSECTCLKSIEIPSGVTGFGESVFRNCSSLKSIILSENINQIGNYAFSNCTSLETIEIPSPLVDISNGMFLGCTNLKEINIQNGVTRVSLDAFNGCSSLMELDLPASITEIAGPAFRECKFSKLIIRGVLGLHLNNHIFDGMDETTIIYAQPSEVEKLQAIYGGSVLPLESL